MLEKRNSQVQLSYRGTGALLTACAIFLGACGSTGVSSTASSQPVAPQTSTPISVTVGSPSCAPCLAMSLLGNVDPHLQVTYQQFANATDATTAVAAGKVDVAQIVYTGLVSAVSTGLPIVAISGEVNGASDFIVGPNIKIKPNDWSALRKLIFADKKAGHLFTIASFFGTVQDIEIRLELPLYGINPNTDVNIVNVPYPAMSAALQSGAADAAAGVEPFAAYTLQNHLGEHFAYPYNQAAGNLTNVVVVASSYLHAHPAAVVEIAKAMAKLIPYLKTPAGQAAWAAAIEKYDNQPASVVSAALQTVTPEISMPFNHIKAIGVAMYKDGLIPSPVDTAALRKAVDYGPLEKATGEGLSALGG